MGSTKSDPWPREFAKEFIEKYRAEPCLWNKEHKHYTNRLIKNLAYNRLAVKAREISPQADAAFVRYKIKVLRTSFRQEYNKVVKSIKMGAINEEIHQPSLSIYKSLLFLVQDQSKEQIDFTPNPSVPDNGQLANPSDCQNYISFSIDAESGEQGAQYFNEPLKQELDDGDENITEETSSTFAMSPLQYPIIDNQVRHRKRSSTRDLSYDQMLRAEEEHNIFGKLIATKLKNINSPTQKHLVEKLIHDVLFAGQMETLNSTSRLITDNMALEHSSS